VVVDKTSPFHLFEVLRGFAQCFLVGNRINAELFPRRRSRLRAGLPMDRNVTIREGSDNWE
jgi:hypothetical protein